MAPVAATSDLVPPAPLGRSEKIFLAALFAVALLLRVFLVHRYESWVSPGLNEHHEVALNLLAGNGYAGEFQFARRGPTSIPYPLYTFMLAGWYWVTGATQDVGGAPPVMNAARAAGVYYGLMMIQCLLSALVPLAAYLIARRIFSRGVSAVAAVLTALDYFLAVTPTYVNQPVVHILLLSLLVLAVFRLAEAPSVKRAVAAGALFGLVALTKTAIAFFLLFASVWLWRVLAGKRRSKLVLVVVVWATASAVLLPWTLRNVLVFKRFIPVSATGGVHVWVGSNPYATGGSYCEDGLAVAEPAHFSNEMFAELTDENGNYKNLDHQVSDIFLRHSLRWIRANPGRFVLLRFRALFYTFFNQNYWMDNPPGPINPALKWLTVAMMVTAIAGLWTARPLTAPKALLLALIGSYALLYSLFHADVDNRFRLPLDPYLLMFAATVPVALWRAAGGVERLKRLPRRYVLCALIFVVALALRLSGIGYGLPYQYHPDESSYVKEALDYGKGQLNPKKFWHPTFFQYVMTLWYMVSFVVGFFARRWRSLVEFQASYIVYTHWFWLLARVFAALLGSLTVYLTYVVGRRRFDVTMGLFAAGILAVSFLHVEHSQYATTDVALTLIVPAVLFMALGIIDRPSPFYYVFGGLFSGLAAATKYPGGMLITAVFAAHFLRPAASTPVRIRRYGLIVSLVWLAVGFWVGCPYALLDAGRFLTDLKFMLAASRNPWLLGSGEAGWKVYLAGTLWSGEGAVFTVVLLLAVLTAAFRSRKDVVLIAFPVVYFLYMGCRPFAFNRFLVPVYPAIALAMARFLLWVISPLKKRALKGAVGAALACVVVAPLLVEQVRLMRFRHLEDPRTRALEWFQAHVPSGSRVLSDYEIYAPPLEPTKLSETSDNAKERVGGKLDQLTTFARKRGLEDDPRLRPFFEAAGKIPRYRVYELRYPTTVDAAPPAKLPDAGRFDAVVLADTWREAILEHRDDARYKPFIPLFREVEEKFTRAKSFGWPAWARAFIERHRLIVPMRIDVFIRKADRREK